MADKKNLHVKPTKEELETENEKLLEELDKPEEEPEESEEENKESEDSEETNEEEPEEKTEEETPDTPETPEEEEPEESEEPKPEPEPNYKKKFSESSKEAQKVVAKNRKLVQAIDEANEVEEPTEDELRAEYTDWDILDDTTKRIARESLISTRRFALISQARSEGKKIEKWDEDVTKFTEDPKTLIEYPELEGKITDFKVFANEESNTNVPFKVLVNSFLYEQSKTKTKNKGKMFPVGSGGPNEKPKSKGDKISVAESEALRQTDYDKYKDLLRRGKIETTI